MDIPRTQRHTPLPTPDQVRQAPLILLRRYQVVSQSHTGGFGTVYTCWDTRLQRRVAIKRLPLTSAYGLTTAQEALHEARCACMLAHPHIVGVFDFEIDETSAYLVMEHLDGLNLAELLARVEGGVLTSSEAASILSSVGKALEFAHQNRVLHLDIKPSNIMIDRTGEVKLTDFGMAMLASAAGYADARGGTIGYMAPEQINGELVDERADIFSLAVVLIQALTGSTPFAADTAEASLKHIHAYAKKPFTELHESDLASPEMLDDLLHHALAPTPYERIAALGDFIEEALEQLGDSHKGKQSLARLVAQDESDIDEEEELAERFIGASWWRKPWMIEVAERLCAGASTAWMFSITGKQLLESLPSPAPLVLPLIAGALAAGIPLIQAPLLLFMWAILVLSSPVLTPLVAVVLVLCLGACGIWWQFWGRHEHLSTPSLLLNGLLGMPWMSSPLAAYTFNPLGASITACLASVLGLLSTACLYSASDVALSFQAILSEPLSRQAILIMIVSNGIGAGIGSFIAGRGRSSQGILGLLMAALCSGIGLIGAQSMENPQISAFMNISVAPYAVFLLVFMSVLTVLRGPVSQSQKDEDEQ